MLHRVERLRSAPRRTESEAAGDHLEALHQCVPVDVVFYAQTDWLRLAQMMRADPSQCAETEYYVSIPPSLVSNPPDTPAKTGLRAARPALARTGRESPARAGCGFFVGFWSARALTAP